MILNFVLLIWEERNLKCYEHARACQERARARRARKKPTSPPTIFRGAAGCVFVHKLQGEVTTAQVDTCTVYKKKYPSTGIPCTAVRVLDLKKCFWKVRSRTLRIIKTYNPYTKILNFVLLIWKERNLGRYEHARACRERARRARQKNPPALQHILVVQ
jgi:hypothetical protein